MLMCRGMIYDLRFIGMHNLIDPVAVTHRADQHYQLKLRISPSKLLLDLICVILIDIEDDQLARISLGDLPAKLAPDRASSSGNHDRAPLDGLEYLIVIDLNLRSSQQV